MLAVGGTAALARLCAAWALGLVRTRPKIADVVVARRHNGLRGATVWQSLSFRTDEITIRNGLPVTTVPRTLVDLAEVLDAEQLANVMHEAAFRRPLNVRALRRSMERNRHRRGHRVVEHALELHLSGSAGTRSDLERRLLQIVRAAGIDEPLINSRVAVAGHRLEVDFMWPRQRVVVEVDGSGHSRPRTRREDGQRDLLLRAAGYEVIRCPARAIDRDSTEFVATLASALRGLD